MVNISHTIGPKQKTENNFWLLENLLNSPEGKTTNDQKSPTRHHRVKQKNKNVIIFPLIIFM